MECKGGWISLYRTFGTLSLETHSCYVLNGTMNNNTFFVNVYSVYIYIYIYKPPGFFFRVVCTFYSGISEFPKFDERKFGNTGNDNNVCFF